MLVFFRSMAALSLVFAATILSFGCGTTESPATCPNDNMLVCKCSCAGQEATFDSCFTASGCNDYKGKPCKTADKQESTFESCALVEVRDQCCF
jgi:hypothetical protein